VTARGDVWIVRAGKLRPAIVLTRDPLADILNEVLVVVCTSTVRGLVTEVPVGLDDGLQHHSVANVDMTQLVSQEAFVRRLGQVRASTMEAICDALHHAIGC
jgi:mRNA interferase MazF